MDDALTLALAFWYAMAHAGAKLGTTPSSSSTDGGFVGSVAGNSPGMGDWVGAGNGLNVYEVIGIIDRVPVATEGVERTMLEGDGDGLDVV